MIDEYLVPNSSFLRLLNEYKQYGTLVVAYDFDNTVFDFHKKGSTYSQVINLLKDCKNLGFTMICFTANSDDKFVLSYCKDNNIPLDKLNENPDFFKSNSKKIYYNIFLDDRAGLISAYQDLHLLIYLIKEKHV